jgi:integrating conjugative element membrane protein (TIGR03747 family)
MEHQHTKNSRSIGLLGSLFWKIFEVIGWLILGGCFTCVISIFIIWYLGEKLALQYLHDILQVQIRWTINKIYQIDYYPLILLSWVEWLQLAVSSVIKKINWIRLDNNLTGLNGYSVFVIKVIKILVICVSTYLKSIIIMTAVFLLRLMDIGLFFPVFLLLNMLGFIDGLVQRDLRRFHGMRESACRYHFIRRLLWPCIKYGWLGYLIMPVAIYPDYILLPFTMLFGFLVASAAKRFKKYV